jgi:hypothetical protein
MQVGRSRRPEIKGKPLLQLLALAPLAPLCRPSVFLLTLPLYVLAASRCFLTPFHLLLVPYRFLL